MTGKQLKRLAMAAFCAAAVLAGAAEASADCDEDRPVAVSVKFQHCDTRPCHWHTVTTFYWDSSSGGYYYFCTNGISHYLDDVDGLYAAWVTTSADTCDYCADYENWEAEYADGGWVEMDSQDCAYDPYSDDILYWGTETDGLDDRDYSSGDWIANWVDDWEHPAILSRIRAQYCPQ